MLDCATVFGGWEESSGKSRFISSLPGVVWAIAVISIVDKLQNAVFDFFAGRSVKEPDESHLAERLPPVAHTADVDCSAGIPETPVFSFIDDAAARFAARRCIDFLGRRYSYSEIGDQVNHAANGFRKLGVSKGVKVGLCLPNTPYFVICYYAILKAGGTVVNYNPLYVGHELAQQVEDSETDIMVTIDLRPIYSKIAGLLTATRLRSIVICPMSDILPVVSGLMFALFKRSEVAEIPEDSRHVMFADLVDNDGTLPPTDISPRRDLAVLQYTGGTTGTPKGAMLTHANLAANTYQVRCWVRGLEEGGERILAVLPLFHVFGMTLVMNLGIYSGAELVLMPRFDLAEVLKTIGRRRITILMGVPTIFTAINSCEELDAYDLSSLKYCISGGAPLPAVVKETFERLAGCTLVEGYGLSECSPVVTCGPLDGCGKDGSAGMPMPGTVVEIRAVDSDREVLPTGEKGEVCIVGPQVMAGYWNKPDETARTLIDGRLHTGDVGYLDEDGYLFLVDRIKDLILCSGYNVYPRVIEEAILRHDAVLETTVIGVPDDYRGETPKAFVRLKDGKSLTEDALKSFLGDKLSPIEMPQFIEFRDELPKTAIGKRSKKELAAAEEAQRIANHGAVVPRETEN